MRQIREFRFNFDDISRDIRESVARHSYECRLVLFSRQIVARCLHIFSSPEPLGSQRELIGWP